VRLLVVADGSGRVRDSVLPWIVRLADQIQPDVKVIHVVKTYAEAWSDEELRDVMVRSRQELNDEMGDAAFATEILVEPLPYGDEIHKYLARRASDLQVDAIVVCSKRATGLFGGILGSVAQGLLRESLVPVIVVRPSDLAVKNLPRNGPGSRRGIRLGGD
jgi:nucleotide-binding universal stress UspA family protein